MLREIFNSLLQDFISDQQAVESRWLEIENRYNEDGRHYHNLLHLENLYTELIETKSSVRYWDVILFSLFYHDIIYNTHRQDNEEESALFAQKALRSMNVKEEKVTLCYSQILATKGHTISKDNDTNIFTDADLSILGKDPVTYQTYASQIRKEYSIYPALIYNPGRKKILDHFLAMDRIFKTDHFYSRYEAAARRNIADELQTLS
jgi:predicted metal-dependent HD superfamily phosphohydrolase